MNHVQTALAAARNSRIQLVVHTNTRTQRNHCSKIYIFSSAAEIIWISIIQNVMLEFKVLGRGC